MKKILLGSVAFFLFSISIALLQTSCGKDAIASPGGSTGSTQLNKIAFFKGILANSLEIWVANYDGSGQTKINLTVPIDWYIYPGGGGPQLSPDGKTIFFVLKNVNTNKQCIYSCKIDGSEVTKIYDGSGDILLLIGGAI